MLFKVQIFKAYKRAFVIRDTLARILLQLLSNTIACLRDNSGRLASCVGLHLQPLLAPYPMNYYITYEYYTYGIADIKAELAVILEIPF